VSQNQGNAQAVRRAGEEYCLTMNRDRWQRLMAAFALPESNETFEQLVDAYSQKHRHYHTGVHIEHCLRELDSASRLAREPAEVELALWFHDVVYDPYSSDNEARSADLACELLNRHGVGGNRVARVRVHIMATRHEAPARQSRGGGRCSARRMTEVNGRPKPAVHRLAHS
jgi:predicted metal-dependent HD superfamily phosphohydrolase